MTILISFHLLPPPRFAWTLAATLQLICERRAANSLFQPHIGASNHDGAWVQISTNLFAITGFRVTANQCRTKWTLSKEVLKIWNASWQTTQRVILLHLRIISITPAIQRCLTDFGHKQVIDFLCFKLGFFYYAIYLPHLL